MKKNRLMSLTAVLAAALPLLGASEAARAQLVPNQGIAQPPVDLPQVVPKRVNPLVGQVEKAVTYPTLESLEVVEKKVDIPVGETRPIGFLLRHFIGLIGFLEDLCLQDPDCSNNGPSTYRSPEITFTSSNNAVAVAPDGMITAVGTGMAEITVTATAREKRVSLNGLMYILTAGSLSRTITVTVTPALPGGGRELTQWRPMPTEGLYSQYNYQGPSGGVECLDELKCSVVESEGVYMDAASEGSWQVALGWTPPVGRSVDATNDGGITWNGSGRYSFVAKEQAWGMRSYMGNRSCWSINVCVRVNRNGIFIPKFGLLISENAWVTAPGTQGAMRGVSCGNRSLCVAVGRSGKIQASTNGGSRWTTLASGTSATLTDVSCRRESWCVAVGANGTILRSANGIDWTASASGTTNSLVAVACGSPQSCVAVGANGTLLTTGDRGVTWTARNTGTTQDLTDISCPRQFFCLVVGRGGTVLRGSP